MSANPNWYRPASGKARTPVSSGASLTHIFAECFEEPFNLRRWPARYETDDKKKTGCNFRLIQGAHNDLLIG